MTSLTILMPSVRLLISHFLNTPLPRQRTANPDSPCHFFIDSDHLIDLIHRTSSTSLDTSPNRGTGTQCAPFLCHHSRVLPLLVPPFLEVGSPTFLSRVRAIHTPSLPLLEFSRHVHPACRTAPHIPILRPCLDLASSFPFCFRVSAPSTRPFFC